MGSPRRDGALDVEVAEGEAGGELVVEVAEQAQVGGGGGGRRCGVRSRVFAWKKSRDLLSLTEALAECLTVHRIERTARPDRSAGSSRGMARVRGNAPARATTWSETPGPARPAAGGWVGPGAHKRRAAPRSAARRRPPRREVTQPASAATSARCPPSPTLPPPPRGTRPARSTGGYLPARRQRRAGVPSTRTRAGARREETAKKKERSATRRIQVPRCAKRRAASDERRATGDGRRAPAASAGPAFTPAPRASPRHSPRLRRWRRSVFDSRRSTTSAPGYSPRLRGWRTSVPRTM